MSDSIIQFKGKRLEEMSRDELVEAIHFLADQYSEFTTSRAMRVRSLGEAEFMKRGGAAESVCGYAYACPGPGHCIKCPCWATGEFRATALQSTGGKP